MKKFGKGEKKKETQEDEKLETRIARLEFRLDNVEHLGEVQAIQIDELDNKLTDYGLRVEKIDNAQKYNWFKSIVAMISFVFILYLIINLSFNFMIYKYDK